MIGWIADVCVDFFLDCFAGFLAHLTATPVFDLRVHQDSTVRRFSYTMGGAAVVFVEVDDAVWLLADGS